MTFSRFAFPGFGNGVRKLARDPTFAAIFIITLALGVGANAALFSALRGYFLAPLPYPHAGRLVVAEQWSNGSGAISASTYNYLRHNAKSLSDGGLVDDDSEGTLTLGDAPTRTVHMGMATASWFKTMGVAPFLGQTFGADADKPGGPNEVVLSYEFWENAMHGNPNVIGETIRVNAAPYTVVAVMPSSFNFSSRRAKFWLPLTINPAALTPDGMFHQRSWRFVARLRSGVSLEAAARELNALGLRQLGKTSTGAQAFFKKRHYHIVTKPLREVLIGAVGMRLLLIELGAALLLLLTAAILANLVTVRTLARRHETALRVALGASRVDLWCAALAETLPLGFIGGVISVGLAWWGTMLIARYGIGTAGTAFHITPDVWIVLFSLALGCVIGALAALPAAFASRKRLLAKLSEGGRGGMSGRARLTQRSLTVVQIALGVALMTNAALLGLTFKQASSHPIGVNSQHLIVAELSFHGARFHDQTSRLAFYRDFGNAARTLPGVVSAGVASILPFGNQLTGYNVSAADSAAPQNMQANVGLVDGHTLTALQVSLVHGRLIGPGDINAKARVAVMDNSLAMALFGTTQAVGRQIERGGRKFRVVGTVRHIRWRAHTRYPASGTLWLPYSIALTPAGFDVGFGLSLAVRSNLPVSTMKHELDALLHKLAPLQAFSSVQSMQALKQRAYHDDQALPVLFGLFSLLALVLSGVGTYGTVAYLIRLRLREFAVRQALGATPGRINLLALAQGATLAVLGIVGGFLLARALSGLITGTGTGTAIAYVAATLVMALAALLATAIPARRARRANLLALLRPQ
ncbi:MAG: ABC transporter permease [Gammaproteobacteria bacterium]